MALEIRDMNKINIWIVMLWSTIFFGSLPNLQAQKPEVLATTTFIADLAQNVAGEEVVVSFSYAHWRRSSYL